MIYYAIMKTQNLVTHLKLQLLPVFVLMLFLAFPLVPCVTLSKMPKLLLCQFLKILSNPQYIK